MSARRIGLVLLAALPCAFAEEAAEDEAWPLSRQAARLMLEQAKDPALEAQKRLFPEHYDELIANLVELKRQKGSKQAATVLTEASRRNWKRYNELVRQGDPNDWYALVVLRRELFAQIGEANNAELCLAYEYQGAQALTTDGNPDYQMPVSLYIKRFLEAAARAREAPQQWRELYAADLDLLHATMDEHSEDPELILALRPSDTVHPRFCEAMVFALDSALTLTGETGELVWRFLVTTSDARPSRQPETILEETAPAEEDAPAAEDSAAEAAPTEDAPKE